MKLAIKYGYVQPVVNKMMVVQWLDVMAVMLGIIGMSIFFFFINIILETFLFLFEYITGCVWAYNVHLIVQYGFVRHVY